METTLLYANTQDLPTPLTIGVNAALAIDRRNGWPPTPLVRFNRLDPSVLNWLEIEDEDPDDAPLPRLLFPPQQ